MPLIGGNPLGFSSGKTSEKSCKIPSNSLGISGAWLEEEEAREILYKQVKEMAFESKEIFLPDIP